MRYIRSNQLGQVRASSTSTHTERTICKNNNAADAEVKCSLSSRLVNVKSLDDSTSDIGNVRIDSDYLVPGNYLPGGVDKVIHIEAIGFDIASVPNGNKVEAIIPPGSCFELELKETITKVVIDVNTGSDIVANVIGLEVSQVTPCE